VVRANAGIPVTHRGHGSLMTVVTAHERADYTPPLMRDGQPVSPSR
jgi:siroheme synthase